jgi:predicted DNA-binding protein (MmcQ/YjbR family)
MSHPRMYEDSNPAIRRLREICLALPEAFEKEAWGECTFRVTGGSMFAMTDNNHHGSKHIAVWVKAPPDVQEMLVTADAKRFFVPPYVGPKGWIGVRLDYKVDWDEVGEILKDGYAMSAPKRLRALASGAAAELRGDAAKKRSTRAVTPGRKPAARAKRAKPTTRRSTPSRA